MPSVMALPQPIVASSFRAMVSATVSTPALEDEEEAELLLDDDSDDEDDDLDDEDDSDEEDDDPDEEDDSDEDEDDSELELLDGVAISRRSSAFSAPPLNSIADAKR